MFPHLWVVSPSPPFSDQLWPPGVWLSLLQETSHKDCHCYCLSLMGQYSQLACIRSSPFSGQWNILAEIVTMSQNSIPLGGMTLWEWAAGLFMRWNPSIPLNSPLDCILKNWNKCDISRPEGKVSCFYIMFRGLSTNSQIKRYSSSFFLHTTFQLDLFCQNSSKWLEVSYVQAFMALSPKSWPLQKPQNVSFAQFNGPFDPVDSFQNLW